MKNTNDKNRNLTNMINSVLYSFAFILLYKIYKMLDKIAIKIKDKNREKKHK